MVPVLVLRFDAKSGDRGCECGAVVVGIGSRELLVTIGLEWSGRENLESAGFDGRRGRHCGTRPVSLKPTTRRSNLEDFQTDCPDPPADDTIGRFC